MTLNDMWVESSRKMDSLGHVVGSGLKDTLGNVAEKTTEYTFGHTRENMMAHPELAIVNWTLFSISASAAMLFAMLCYQARSKGALIPVLNLFVSVVMMMTYYGLAVIERNHRHWIIQWSILLFLLKWDLVYPSCTFKQWFWPVQVYSSNFD
jgi:hypothetical protein